MGQRHPEHQSLDSRCQKSWGILGHGQEVGLLVEPADSPPLCDRDGGKHCSLFILGLGGEFLVRELLDRPSRSRRPFDQ